MVCFEEFSVVSSSLASISFAFAVSAYWESSGIVASPWGSVVSLATADETSAAMVGETSGRRRLRVDFVT